MIRFVVNESYGSSHEAPSNDGFCVPLNDLTGLYPSDIYSSNAYRLYGEGRSYAKKTMDLIQSYKSKPEASVTIYRAVPKKISSINRGDWITLTKEYASEHGKRILKDFTLLSKVVKAKQVWSNADSIYEFGYD